MSNDHLVLISGKSATGKSASLMQLENPEGVLYLNCENNKKLPFKSKFEEKNIVAPKQIYEAFDYVAKSKNYHTVVIDTLTYLMDMYETQEVLTAANTQKAWGGYSQYWKKLMVNYVAQSDANVIFLGHTADMLNEKEMAMETMVKVKGALMNTGIESYFSTVISTKKVPLTMLDGVENDLLTVTDEEKALGFKYVYQTKLTKDSVHERMRSSIGMWGTHETFIDNNAQHVINRLREYY